MGCDLLRYARLRPGPEFRPLRATLYYCQSLVTNDILRSTISTLIATGIRMRHPLSATHVGAASSIALSSLVRDGCAGLGAMLDPAQVQEIHNFLADKEMLSSAGDPVTTSAYPQDVGVAAYPLATILACPYLLDLANAHWIIALASAYLGCKPTISSIGLRWFFPNGSRQTDVQHFHRDPDDWRFLKFFVYLTDVTMRTGPHLFVRTSHRGAGDLRCHIYSRDEIEQKYGAEQIQPFLGDKGTGFIANTRGIHCAAAPLDGPRLIFQVQYSLLPVFAFLYQPEQAAQQIELDPYINRLIVARSNS